MIFCVEDDSSIRELMLYTLRASGYEAEGFSEGNAMVEALNSAMPELILLDIMLPGADGLELLSRLRQDPATARVPVIFASAKGTEYDKVLGLESGADDYLTKPFSMLEMISRVRAVLRRCTPVSETAGLTAGRISMNAQAHTVCVDGVRVELTLKEFELLKQFLTHPGQVFSREQLLERVWGEEYLGESRTVDVHIGTLRTKLGDAGSCICTVRGVGYRMEKDA